jgi:four helix bundle protein
MGTRFRRLTVYKQAVELADALWRVVGTWDSCSRWSLGIQLTRASDSIGANIAEAYGRRSDPDQGRFLLMARGSAYEAEHWIQRAIARQLISDEYECRIAEVTRTLNGLIRAHSREA